MTITIRPRTAADVPRLVEVLAGQQPGSGYPFRWPLPFPAEQFVVRAAEESAWVAVVDDVVVVGQVAVLSVPDDALGRAWAAAVDLPVTRLGLVASFFVAEDLRGLGVGRGLLEKAVAWIRERDRVPVLDVVPGHARAVRLYESTGWREVGRARPHWLPDAEPPVILMVLDPGGLSADGARRPGPR